MAEPTRVRCENLDVNSLLECVEENVTREKHLVFEIESQLLPNGKYSQREIVESLALALPHCSVFDSGGREGVKRITVLQVISEQEIIAHEDEIVLAARSFRRLANELMKLQSEKLGVDFNRIASEVQSGQLDENWSCWVHGEHCLYESRDGQIVEVWLEFAPEYGVLDPYFFYQYIESTPMLKKLSELFTSPFHDMNSVFETLHRRGKLRLINDVHGYIAPNGEI